MESSITKHHKNLGAIIHVSTFSKYFIPFGNFIIPLILWTSNKNQSDFVDYNGKQALNFQISLLLYSMVIGIVAIPFFFFSAWDFIGFYDLLDHNTHEIHFNFRDFFSFSRGWIFLGISGLLGLALFVLDIFCTIIATIRANEGIMYKYPFTINFIK
jgi:hypothetical protein